MTVVTGVKENTAAASSVTTSSVNMTGMTYLLVGVSNYRGATTTDDATTAVTDSAGNTWTKISGSVATNDSYTEFFHVNSNAPTVSSTQTFTYHTTNAGDFLSIAVLGWDGEGNGVAASPLDQDAGWVLESSGTTASTNTTGTTAQTNELLVSVFGGGNGAGTVTVANKAGASAATWTLDQNQQSASGQPIALAHALVTATGTFGATWTDSASFGAQVGGQQDIVTIKEGTGGGGGGTQYYSFLSVLGVG